MDHNLRIIATPIAGLLLLAGLAACDGGDPVPAETPTPTPIGPVRAPDDPDWTENQLAAVLAVDAYNEVITELWSDLENIDFSLLFAVAADPQYTSDITSFIRLQELDSRYVGAPVTPVIRTVGRETEVGGVPEIRVTQCDADDPDAYIVQQGVERPVSGNPRVEYIYTVQWQAGAGVWKVALVEKGRESC
jgi:hypothetical protein